MNHEEKTLENKIIAIAKKLGYWAHHNSSEGDTGRFDILFCGKSYFWVEVKSKKGQIRPEQAAWAVDYLSEGGKNLFLIREQEYSYCTYIFYDKSVNSFSMCHDDLEDSIRAMITMTEENTKYYLSEKEI